MWLGQVIVKHSRRIYNCKTLVYRPCKSNINSVQNTMENSIKFFLNIYLGWTLSLYDSTLTTNMEKTNTLLDRKDILKEITYGNLKKIYKMQAKSYRSIFRVYQKQDNFLTELRLRKEVMSQTSFSYISINSSTILMVLTAPKSPWKDPLINTRHISK